MKILYIDVETTGLDWNRHGIVQLAFIIEVDGQIVEQHEFKILPFIEDEVDHKAIKVHGIGRAFPIPAGQPIASPKGSPGFRFEWHEDQRPAKDVWQVVKAIWSKYVDKYHRTDKFVVAGYNVQGFDIPFLRKWIEKCEPSDRYSVAGSFLGWYCLDPLPIIQLWKVSGHFKDNQLPNLKLATVCALLDIDLPEAHDAMLDIMATRILCKRVQASQCDLDWGNLYNRLEIEGEIKLDKKEPAEV